MQHVAGRRPVRVTEDIAILAFVAIPALDLSGLWSSAARSIDWWGWPFVTISVLAALQRFQASGRGPGWRAPPRSATPRTWLMLPFILLMSILVLRLDRDHRPRTHVDVAVLSVCGVLAIVTSPKRTETSQTTLISTQE